MVRSLRLAFILGLLWGLLPVALGRHWLGLDLFRMDLGGMCEWKNLLFSGQPLWVAPHLGLGAPFAFDPLQGVFYPPKWLYFWLPGFLATDAHVAFHFAVAASGMTLLARSFGLRRTPALVLGLCYLFSGTLIDLAKHSPYLIGGAWLPWAWAFARLSARKALKSRLRHSLGLVSTLGLMLLGGDAFTFLWGFFLALLEGVARRSVLRLGVLACLGGAVGLIVWWPALLELASSGRHEGLGLEGALRWSFSPLDFPGVILAGLFRRGSLLGGSVWSLLHDLEGSFPWNESPFLGLVAIVSLGFLPWSARRWRMRLGIAPAVLLLALLLALGAHLPVAGWFYRLVPFLTNLRYPAKHWVVINLVALLMAGLSLARLGRSAGRVVLGVWVTLGIGLLLGREHWIELSRALATSQGWEWSDAAPTAAGVLARALMPGALAGSALLALRGRKPGVLFIAMLVELVGGAALSVEWMPREQASLPLFSPLRTLDEGSVACLANPVERFGLTQRSLEKAEDLASLLLYQQLAALPQLNACEGVVMAHGYSIVRHGIQRQLQLGMGDFPSAARALGCTHLVSLGGSGEIDLEVAGLRAQKVVDPVPEFFASSRLHPIAPGKGEREYVGLTRIEMRAADLLSHVAYADEASVARFRSAASGEGGADSPLEVNGSKRSASSYRIGFGSSPRRTPVMVGVRTSYARGWKAWQAGRRIPVVAAGGIFLAALVDDPSVGEVEFRYGW